MLGLFQVSSHTANATCRLLGACVCVCPGSGTLCWLNPRLSAKSARLLAPMTLNTHMAVLGKTNGRKMEYTSAAGTEKRSKEIILIQRSNQPSQTLKESGREDFYVFCSVWVRVGVCAGCVCIPSHHLRVVIDRDIRPVAAVVGTEVAVWSTKPFIKTMLQR